MNIEIKRPEGYCFLNFDNGVYIINALHVLSKYRRHGIGTKLIKTAESIVPENSFVYLYVKNNTWQHKWYEKLGYKPSDVKHFIKMRK